MWSGSKCKMIAGKGVDGTKISGGINNLNDSEKKCFRSFRQTAIVGQNVHKYR